MAGRALPCSAVTVAAMVSSVKGCGICLTMTLQHTFLLCRHSGDACVQRRASVWCLQASRPKARKTGMTAALHLPVALTELMSASAFDAPARCDFR